MTSTPEAGPPRRVAIVGTGLIGCSIGLAAARAGLEVAGYDADEGAATGAARAGLTVAGSLEAALEGSELVVVATPIEAVCDVVVAALGRAPAAVVTDVASVKSSIVRAVAARGAPLDRFVPGHPMGGSERSGPEHASASLVDGIAWALAPTPATAPASRALVEAFVRALGARPVELDPERHDRLVAVVSHLPQVASTALMDLAAAEEADEPELLVLAAGGFRDLTRLAASSPGLWSAILLANREEVARAIDRYVEGLVRLRDDVARGDAARVEATFASAKAARLGLAAKPQVRAGVAVVQVPIPDRPGALAQLTGGLAERGVNIEDLQIVHSPEGGSGLVQVIVAATAGDAALEALLERGFDPVRLA